MTVHDVAASEAAHAAVRAAFEEHSVGVLRDQDVTDEAQLGFSRRFGPIEVTKVGSEDYRTNLVILKTLDDQGNVVLEDHRLALENKRLHRNLALDGPGSDTYIVLLATRSIREAVHRCRICEVRLRRRRDSPCVFTGANV